MSVEGIIDQLRARGLKVSTLEYNQPNVSVYKGMYLPNFPAAIKVLSCSGQHRSNPEAECQAMMALQHENILRLYNYFWLSKGDLQYFIIATEWCNKDLEKDTDQRRRNNFPWNETDLWKIINRLVSALAYMQRQGYAHRDIKPGNLFYMGENYVKIGDFGSAIKAEPGRKFPIAGTPNFMSPILRHALMTRQNTANHNPYKSDVYSLGISFLQMSTLSLPTSLLTNSISDEIIANMLGSLMYSDRLKQLLASMLKVNEWERCDFQQIEDWINPSQTLTVSLEPVEVIRAEVDVIYAMNAPGAELQQGANVEREIAMNETEDTENYYYREDIRIPAMEMQPARLFEAGNEAGNEAWNEARGEAGNEAGNAWNEVLDELLSKAGDEAWGEAGRVWVETGNAWNEDWDEPLGKAGDEAWGEAENKREVGMGGMSLQTYTDEVKFAYKNAFPESVPNFSASETWKKSLLQDWEAKNPLFQTEIIQVDHNSSCGDLQGERLSHDLESCSFDVSAREQSLLADNTLGDRKSFVDSPAPKNEFLTDEPERKFASLRASSDLRFSSRTDLEENKEEETPCGGLTTCKGEDDCPCCREDRRDEYETPQGEAPALTEEGLPPPFDNFPQTDFQPANSASPVLTSLLVGIPETDAGPQDSSQEDSYQDVDVVEVSRPVFSQRSEPENQQQKFGDQFLADQMTGLKKSLAQQVEPLQSHRLGHVESTQAGYDRPSTNPQYIIDYSSQGIPRAVKQPEGPFQSFRELLPHHEGFIQKPEILPCLAQDHNTCQHLEAEMQDFYHPPEKGINGSFGSSKCELNKSWQVKQHSLPPTSKPAAWVKSTKGNMLFLNKEKDYPCSDRSTVNPGESPKNYHPVELELRCPLEKSCVDHFEMKTQNKSSRSRLAAICAFLCCWMKRGNKQPSSARFEGKDAPHEENMLVKNEFFR